MKLRMCAFSSDNKFVVYLGKFLSSIADISIEVEFFSSPSEFCVDTYKRHFDIILIDIDSIEYNTLGCLEINHLESASICMVSSQSLFEYDPNIWTFRKPLTLILKKHMGHKLLSIIQDKASKLRSKPLIIKANNTIHRLYYSEIMVVDPIGHYLDFYVTNYPEPINTRMPINSIKLDLLENHFIVVKGNTYVNCDYIKIIDKTTKKIVLENGMHLNYSRRNWKAIKEKVMEGK